MRFTLASLLALAAFLGGCWQRTPDKDKQANVPPPPQVPKGDEPGAERPIAKGRMYQDLQQHTSSPPGANDLDPWVTPNGTLYFASNRHSRYYDIYSKPVRGTAMTVLTAPKHEACNKRFPALSPDGRWLAFASDLKGTWSIYLLDLKEPSAEWRAVTSGGTDDYHPSWSPDGARIAFCRRSIKFGGWEVWTISPDGTSPSPIADGYLPAWCPDEKQPWIVFQRPRQRDDPWYGLWKAHPDGNLLTELLPAETFGAVTPAWGPHGKWIAFSAVSRRAAGAGGAAGQETEDLYVLRADGEVRMQITSQDGVDAMPFWAEDGRLYFAESATSGAQAHFNIWSLEPLLPE